MAPTKCSVCKKKLSVVALAMGLCRCNQPFCIRHRSKHTCTHPKSIVVVGVEKGKIDAI